MQEGVGFDEMQSIVSPERGEAQIVPEVSLDTMSQPRHDEDNSMQEGIGFDGMQSIVGPERGEAQIVPETVRAGLDAGNRVVLERQIEQLQSQVVLFQKERDVSVCSFPKRKRCFCLSLALTARRASAGGVIFFALHVRYNVV